jgi:UDP-glucose 4-epimerase
MVTGSAGHLGEALVRVLRDGGHDVTGLDLKPSPYTAVVGSVTDRALVRRCMAGSDAVLHTASLHKPHADSHGKHAFVDTNVTGTLTLLEEAAQAGVGSFVFTSSTSAFGRALTPEQGEPAAWVTEDVVPRPRNIYGVTKTAADGSGRRATTTSRPASTPPDRPVGERARVTPIGWLYDECRGTARNRFTDTPLPSIGSASGSR